MINIWIELLMNVASWVHYICLLFQARDNIARNENPLAKALGITIYNELVQVDARILQPPYVLLSLLFQNSFSYFSLLCIVNNTLGYFQLKYLLQVKLKRSSLQMAVGT